MKKTMKKIICFFLGHVWVKHYDSETSSNFNYKVCRGCDKTMSL